MSAANHPEIERCLTRGPSSIMELWAQICAEDRASREQWVAALRAAGFKGAHPNDGWVDRDKQTLQMVYPDFDDGVEIGSRVMIGCHSDAKRGRVGRPVVIIGVSGCCWGGAPKFIFQDLGQSGGAA